MKEQQVLNLLNWPEPRTETFGAMIYFLMSEKNPFQLVLQISRQSKEIQVYCYHHSIVEPSFKRDLLDLKLMRKDEDFVVDYQNSNAVLITGEELEEILKCIDRAIAYMNTNPYFLPSYEAPFNKNFFFV